MWQIYYYNTVIITTHFNIINYNHFESCTCPERPWGPPSHLYNGYRVFPRGRRPGRGFDYPTHLTPMLKKE